MTYYRIICDNYTIEMNKYFINIKKQNSHYQPGQFCPNIKCLSLVYFSLNLMRRRIKFNNNSEFDHLH